MATYELWKQEGEKVIAWCFVAVEHRTSALAGFDPRKPAPTLVWTVEAGTYIDAIGRVHESTRWESYKPMVDEGSPDRTE